MFERYTERARRVIFLALDEARQFGSPYITTEHILLGFLREDAGKVRWLVPDLAGEEIRKTIETGAPRGTVVSSSVDLPLTRGARRVMESAIQEADRLGHRHVGTEHILLALTVEEDSLAAQILKRYRITAERAREAAAGSIGPLWSEEKTTGAKPIQIHGTWWNEDYLRPAAEAASKFLWEKRDYKPSDALIEIQSKRLKLYAGGDFDAAKFQVVKGGWKQDRCFICGWRMLESPETDRVGYTNGQDWLCAECYEKVVKPRLESGPPASG